jgi:hypothetical protein
MYNGGRDGIGGEGERNEWGEAEMFVEWLKFCNKCTWKRLCAFMGVGHNRLTARSRNSPVLLMANY